MKTLLILLVVLLGAAPATAQATREGTIAGEQAVKATQLGTEGPSEAEMVVRRVLLSPLLSGGDGVYPWFGSVFGGSGMSAGAGFLKRLQRGAAVNAMAGISIKGSTTMRGSFVAPELWRGLLHVDAAAEWTQANKVSFYGFGQDSLRAMRMRYDYTPLEFGGNLTIRPLRYLSLTGGYTRIGFETQLDGEAVEDLDVPGLNRQLDFHVARGAVAVDWRPARAYSTRGGLVRATFERNTEVHGQPYSFTSQEYEALQQVPLVREQFVLAVRALVTLTDSDGGAEVPVVMMPYLGSGSTLRGFKNRRFTDRNRVLLVGEYRWRPSRYLDMALFLDAGQVASERSAFDVTQFDVNWGIGARFHGPTFTAFRVDVAHGREGFHVIWSGTQPF